MRAPFLWYNKNMNNILHLKYAVEVARTGSISKAAENLYMSQPHLSRAIRELEASAGIAIFKRTNSGVTATEQGTEFLAYAEGVLEKMAEMEAVYRPSSAKRQKFSAAVPRASYIAAAFQEFARRMLKERDMDADYRETHSLRAIKNVSDGQCSLGVVRFQAIYEEYFLGLIAEQQLHWEPLLKFQARALMSSKSPLAEKNRVSEEDLKSCIEIIHGDTSIPSLPAARQRVIATELEGRRKIYVYERGSQLELLSGIPETYMMVSPVPREVRDRFQLTEKACDRPDNLYQDLLIYQKDRKFSEADALFIALLKEQIGKMENP